LFSPLYGSPQYQSTLPDSVLFRGVQKDRTIRRGHDCNLREAKRDFWRLVKRVQVGEEILIAHHESAFNPLTDSRVGAAIWATIRASGFANVRL
jgi:hypothetical protein